MDDPVLRYMVDALWADRRVGEAEVPVFAFASHSQGGELEAKERWAAKGIVPIQYVDTKQAIVARGNQVTENDDVVGHAMGCVPSLL